MESGKELKEKNRRRSQVFGTWTSFGHPSITEILAAAGMDFVGIDMEHSTISQEQAQRIIAAAHASGAACLPRPASHDSSEIARLLDSGADGIIIPNVSRPDEVDRLIVGLKYPPVGGRGYGVARAQGYGFDFQEYASSWNERSVLLLQIESMKAVKAVEELIAPEEVDGVMIGPYDISGSLGIPGQLSHPDVQGACAQVIRACEKYGKTCGTQIVDPTPANVEEAARMGYRFLVLASDLFILWKWSERIRRITRGEAVLHDDRRSV